MGDSIFPEPRPSRRIPPRERTWGKCTGGKRGGAADPYMPRGWRDGIRLEKRNLGCKATRNVKDIYLEDENGGVNRGKSDTANAFTLGRHMWATFPMDSWRVAAASELEQGA
jgi:hypothetical protein